MKKTLFCLYMMLCGFGLSLLAQNNPTIKLPDYNEIVSNYKYIGIEQREGKANLEDFTALCKGQLSYLKKDQGDELDKLLYLAYIIHSGFISGYQNRYGDNLKPPTNVYHRMTA